MSIAALIMCGAFSAAHWMRANDFCLCINQSSFVPIADGYDIVDAFKVQQKQVVRPFALTTKSGAKVPAILYDRNSKVLLIAGPPLPISKEGMKVFAELFPSYDVVLFDYRWSGKYGSYLVTSLVTGEAVKRVLLDPVEDLEIVVDYATKRKKYKKIVGLGECYSCFHFAKVQSDAMKKYGVGPFTHLILDSCWSSLRDFAERICFDPYLPLDSRDGGAPKIITWITNSFFFKYIILGVAFYFLEDISIDLYIADVSVPILFVHGKNDLFVPLEHFQKIWSVADSENRAVLLTPFKHVQNLGDKRVYRYMVEQFVISQSMHEFEEKVL